LPNNSFFLGKTYYDQGAYKKAVKLFEESLRLSKKPDLLYNIAKCHESLGNLEKAIKSYESYLKKTGRSDSVIEARLRNLKQRFAAQKAREQAHKKALEDANARRSRLQKKPQKPKRKPRKQASLHQVRAMRSCKAAESG
jgi:tetratricopeptide (TPR) repeat protein